MRFEPSPLQVEQAGSATPAPPQTSRWWKLRLALAVLAVMATIVPWAVEAIGRPQSRWREDMLLITAMFVVALLVAVAGAERPVPRWWRWVYVGACALGTGLALFHFARLGEEYVVKSGILEPDVASLFRGWLIKLSVAALTGAAAILCAATGGRGGSAPRPAP